MIGGLLRRLGSHPMVSIVVSLVVVIAAAIGMVRVLEATLTGSGPSAGEALATPGRVRLPQATESLATEQAEPVHRALHALGSACRRDPDGRRQDVLRTLDVITTFVARHPTARFPVDDESGTTLALLFVVRDELRTCAPTLVNDIDRLIPAEYRP